MAGTKSPDKPSNSTSPEKKNDQGSGTAQKPDAVPSLEKLIAEAFKRHPEQARASKVLKMVSEIAR